MDLAKPLFSRGNWYLDRHHDIRNERRFIAPLSLLGSYTLEDQANGRLLVNAREMYFELVDALALYKKFNFRKRAKKLEKLLTNIRG